MPQPSITQRISWLAASLRRRMGSLKREFSKQVTAATCLTTLAVLIIAGCGKKTAPTGSVAGRVTYASQPVTQGTVVFENRTEGQFRAATLDSNGQYQLPEVRLGEYNVSVQPPAPELPNESSGTPAQIRAKMATVKVIDPKDIPRPFRAFETTPLKRSVESGANTFDFDLSAQK